MIALVLVLLLGLAVVLSALAWRSGQVERRLDRAESGLRRLRGLQAEALALEAARGRFRRRQREVERAVETGARGVESAHRTLAGRLGWPAGEGIYRRLRGLNRAVGRGVSGLLAPSTTARRRESMARWRARRKDRPDRDDN